MTMLKILCKLVSKQQSNSMLKKVKSLMRNASSYPLSNLWFNSNIVSLYYSFFLRFHQLQVSALSKMKIKETKLYLGLQPRIHNKHNTG